MVGTSIVIQRKAGPTKLRVDCSTFDWLIDHAMSWVSLIAEMLGERVH
jgi:hypothetical protein